MSTEDLNEEEKENAQAIILAIEASRENKCEGAAH